MKQHKTSSLSIRLSVLKLKMKRKSSSYKSLSIPVKVLFGFLFLIFSNIFSVVFNLINVISRKLTHVFEPLLAKVNFKRNRQLQVNLAILAVTVVSVVYAFNITNVGLEVSVNGEVIGYVSSEAELNAAIAKIEAETSETLGRPYTFSEDVTVSLKTIDNTNIITSLDATDSLNPNLSSILSVNVAQISTLAVVKVDGTIIGAVPTESDAVAVLDMIAADHIGDDEDAYYEFVEDVEIAIVEGSADMTMTRTELYDKLNVTTQGEIYYTVKSGDTLSQIASANDMTTSEITALNADVNPSTLQIGQQVLVSAAIPMLSVLVLKDIEYEESIAYSTIKQNNDTLALNSTKTVVSGVNGLADVEATVTYLNGVEVDRTITSSTVLKEPVSAVVDVGTKIIPGVGTGVMMNPFSAGSLTSNYGWRYNGKEFHTGIDLAGTYGSTVVAADTGTVTFSGWNGNYGYCVIISHGNGITTLYAHNSSLLVKVGDIVEKGQAISKVGSTGNSTGNHLHFEVRVNGTHVSPANYIYY